MTKEERYLQRDRLRFIKNSTSANFALLAIVFDVLYFVNIYQSNVGSWYYNIIMGASIIYNLIFLLAAFLSSEGVKNYKRNYSWILLALGAGQIIRIFIIPMRAVNAVVSIGGVDIQVMKTGQFIYLLVCLVLSALCLFYSAMVNFNRCSALEAHNRTLARKRQV